MRAASVTHVLFDFADAVAVDQWFATDDRVMGGVSQSRMRFDPSGVDDLGWSGWRVSTCNPYAFCRRGLRRVAHLTSDLSQAGVANSG